MEKAEIKIKSGFPGRFWAACGASSHLPEAHLGCSLQLFIFYVSVFLPFQRIEQYPGTVHLIKGDLALASFVGSEVPASP